MTSHASSRDRGVDALGKQPKTTAPGTEAIGAVIEAAGGSALFLFDEVLNFMNRHRDMADGFYAFIQNLTIALTGATRAAAVISLPRSQVEMTDWDTAWQEKISKVVRRVSKDLIDALRWESRASIQRPSTTRPLRSNAAVTTSGRPGPMDIVSASIPR